MEYVIWGTDQYAEIVSKHLNREIKAFINETSSPVNIETESQIINETDFFQNYKDEYIIISNPFQYYLLRSRLEEKGLKEVFQFSGGFEYLPLMELFNNRTYHTNSWKDANELYSIWNFRVEQMSQYIDCNIHSVIDLGCGNAYLKQLLPSNIQYIGCDYMKRTLDTYIYNFNNHEFPEMIPDLFFISGCLEYLRHSDWFLSKLLTARKKIMSAGSPKEAYEVLSQNGIDMDYNTFLETIENLKTVYEKQKAGLLTEEDMDNVVDNLNSDEAVGSIFFFLIPGVI